MTRRSTRRSTSLRYRPLALPGLAAAVALAATGHPWWVLAAMFIGSLEVWA